MTSAHIYERLLLRACGGACVRRKQFGNVVQMAGNIFIAKDRQRKLLPNCMRGEELYVTPFTSPFTLLSQMQYTSCIVLSSHLPFSWDPFTSCSGESNTTKYNMEHCSSSPLIVTDCKNPIGRLATACYHNSVGPVNQPPSFRLDVVGTAIRTPPVRSVGHPSLVT